MESRKVINHQEAKTGHQFTETTNTSSRNAETEGNNWEKTNQAGIKDKRTCSACSTKECKPDNIESHNSLKLSFINVWGLRSNFVTCEPFLESTSHDIHTLCETNFLCGGLSYFNLKEFCYSYASPWSYVKEEFPFVQNLSLENSADSYLCFQLALLHSNLLYFSVSLLIPLLITFYVFMQSF